ncbi:putative defensin-like protein 180 [Vicia villosa]|uniref:putative defensin-like protein 180 n=1 Tax=Vicia villosa TaxID=3911 RepID=UPI00273B1C9D|nr:putative defensin-like protein 180 [Vicia villosa]
MANQMSKSSCFFAVLVLVFAVQFIQIDGECSVLVGDCKMLDCTAHCNFFAKGVRVLKASCSYLHLCMCTFDRPPPGGPESPCDVVLGVCTNDCNYECCDKKCKASFPNTGSGTCLEFFGQDLCLCSYKR